MWYLAKCGSSRPEFFTKTGDWGSAPDDAYGFKTKSRACVKQNQMRQEKRYRNEIRVLDQESLDRCRIELLLDGA